MRQVQRIYQKYLEKGDEGLNHGLVGRRGNNNKDEIRELALELYRKNYQGWGAVLAEAPSTKAEKGFFWGNDSDGWKYS